MTLIKSILYLVLMTGILSAQNKTIIEGIITDQNNAPLPYANVFLLNSSDGNMSNDVGSYSFKTSATGKATLTATIVGYGKYSKEIEIISGIKNIYNIEMNISSIKLNESVVTASSYGSEKGKGLVISRMDVLTTPGGATDIYQSLKTMPGVTQVSESAELYVRGGDPIETTTMINQAAVYHPFTFESSYGGIFSNLNQSTIKSMYFTSGGFSAKYGNALSGVLDIETKNQPENTRTSIGLSLANVNITSEIAIDPAKFGLYFDARQNYTRPIFWLNGGSDRLTVSPESKNFTGGMVYNYSKTGRLKFFNIYSEDKQGVKVERAEYNGEFNGNSKNLFFNIQNTDVLFGALVIKNSVAFNKYSNQWLLGILDITKTDYVYSLRSDLEIVVWENLKLFSGIEFEDRKIKYVGKIPEEDFNIRPDSRSIKIDAQFKGMHYGLYSEVQASGLLGIKNLSATAGMRYDDFFGLNKNWMDPRIGFGYKLDESSTFRFAWGIFRQLPETRLLSPVDGNPSLQPMKSEHFIASYEYTVNENNSFRIEVYNKNYTSLPLEDKIINYNNSGHGFANGVDIIFKGIFPFGINGWVSYGYINTKRLWLDYDSFTSSGFNITHNISLVAKYNLSEILQLGITAKYATGRPYTPVAYAEFNDDYNLYEPLYAKTNSGRFPDYRRIDMRLTYFGKIFGGYPLIAYIEGINILNFSNIFGYSYSPDYKEKKEIKSYFGRRMLVMGFTITL